METSIVTANIMLTVSILSMLRMLIPRITPTGRSGEFGSVGGFCKYVEGTMT